MRTLFLVLLFIALPLASGSLTPELESEYWKGTGLDLAYTKRLISNEICAQNDIALKACRAAVGAGRFHARLAAKLPVAKNGPVDFEGYLDRILAARPADLPLEMLLGRMISAYLKVYDHFAQIVPTEVLQLVFNGESKTFFTYGLQTEATGAGLMVFRVHRGTSAFAAGLKPNDRIVRVGGNLIDGLESARAIEPLLYPSRKSSVVKIEVERGSQVFDAELISAPMSFEPITETLIEADGRTYAHLSLRSFSRGNCDLVKNKLESYRAMGVRFGGLIFDLRHNPGGLVSEGDCIAKLFVGSVPVIKRTPIQLAYPEALSFPIPAITDEAELIGPRVSFKEIPLVVLIDAASASMSEVVAGSLQGYRRALIVGERSFGKSFTQTTITIPDLPKIKLVRSTARFELPDAIARPEAGVAPDYVIAPINGASAARRTYVREFAGLLPPPEREPRPDRERCLANKELESTNRLLVAARFGFSDEQAAFALSLLECQ